jgi:hypothetical protein
LEHCCQKKTRTVSKAVSLLLRASTAAFAYIRLAPTSVEEDLQHEAEDGVQRGRVLREQRHVLQRRDQLEPARKSGALNSEMSGNKISQDAECIDEKEHIMARYITQLQQS